MSLSDSASEQIISPSLFSTTIPRSGAQLLTPKQKELLAMIGDAGSLPHGKIRAPTASVLLGNGYIAPSNDGQGFTLTEEGKVLYRELQQTR
jgi:hypothetical protein